MNLNSKLLVSAIKYTILISSNHEPSIDCRYEILYKIPNIREPANFRSSENHSPDHEWRPILSRRIYIRLFDHAEGMPRKKEKLWEGDRKNLSSSCGTHCYRINHQNEQTLNGRPFVRTAEWKCANQPLLKSWNR